MSSLIGASIVNGATTDFAFSRVPSRFDTLDLTAGSRGMGEVCLGREVFPDGTVCNSAYLAQLDESTLLVRVFFGNGYTALSTANSLLNDQISKEFLQDLFTKNSISSVEAHAGLYFATRYFSAAFSPYRVQYFSEIHNPNLPVIAIHAANERSLSFGGALPMDKLSEGLRDFTLGAKLRVLERTYVHGEFSSFDLINKPTSELLPTKTQQAVFLDPSLAWAPSEAPWRLHGSAALKNVGAIWPEDSLYPDKTDFGLGAGIEPPTGVGRLRIALDAVDLLRATALMDRFRLGASFKYGLLEPMVGLNSSALTAGTYFALQIFQVGIVYEFIRKDLDGNEPENRIATEVSIKL